MLETIPKSQSKANPVTYKFVSETLIEGEKGPVVLDFSASWCGPCKNVYPVLEALAIGFPKVKFFKVDVSKDAEDVSEKYEVQSLPTIIFFNGGEIVSRDEGVGEGAKNILDSFAKILVESNQYTSKEDAQKAIGDVLSDCEKSYISQSVHT